MKTLFLILVLAIFSSVHSPAKETAPSWPLQNWAKVAPADAGLEEARLVEARDYALTGGGSGCIIRGGKLVFAWGDQAQRYDLKSTTKSFGAAAFGLAIKDGKVQLSDKARSHHPTLGVPPESNAASGWIEDITLLQLASQTAGFDKAGGYVPLLFKPGTEWSYSDSGPNWLAECVTLAFRRDLDELMFERIFTPLGIQRADLVWRKNQYRPELIDGIERREFGAGISANVNAMARFGLLWLRGGEWNGTQILPRDYVNQVRTTVSGAHGLKVRLPGQYSNAANHYGLLWWNNADETIEGLPVDTYWSWGLYDSLIVVMPALDMVVARAGQSWKRTGNAHHYEVLKPFLLPIVAAAGAKVPVKESAAPSSAPYPPSPVIQGIEWAPAETIVRLAKGSDNWPMTWADDDALYTAYGDGNGFEPFVKGKLSMGFAKISGTPPDIRGENVRSATGEALGDGKQGRKASGMLCIDGILYALVRNAANSQLGWSTDHGATWAWADWRFQEGFGCPTFLNFGRNYAEARDGFAYIYSQDSSSAYDRADRFVMARAPKGRLRDRTAYEFFARLDANGEPQWSADITQRGAVFSDPGGCYRSSISYDAAIKRYLWCQIGAGDDTRFQGGFAIYDAPEPWGPWTTAFHTGSWDTGPGESSSLPTKWMSADGSAVHLVFSGEDHFSVRKGFVALRGSNSPAFLKSILSDKYYCDGIHAGDFNRDGKPDIVAGPFWYEGPEFTSKHEIYPPKEFPTMPAPTDSMFSYVFDFNRDGWQDILVLGRVHLHQAFWYENPQGKAGPWQKHFVFERVKGESPPFLDVDGDGKPELVAHWEDRWGLIQPDSSAPEKPWHFTPITAVGKWDQFHHGTGIGDVNGDGRLDLILNDGWWEQPAERGAIWTAHPGPFSNGRGGAQMFAYDVNGDGLPDVITALDSHGWGLAWFEQVKESGQITFKEHKLMGDRTEEAKFGVCFSQPHAMAMADLDGDGLEDIVVGKRMWAHPPPKDIEPDAAPVLYWFQLKRGSDGSVTFVPHLIDDRSGVGVQVTTADVNGDGKLDILTVSKLGTFVFQSKSP